MNQIIIKKNMGDYISSLGSAKKTVIFSSKIIFKTFNIFKALTQNQLKFIIR